MLSCFVCVCVCVKYKKLFVGLAVIGTVKATVTVDADIITFLIHSIQVENNLQVSAKKIKSLSMTTVMKNVFNIHGYTGAATVAIATETNPGRLLFSLFAIIKCFVPFRLF